jgi:transposase, IS5 family
MHPKRQETETQYDLFKIALADLLNPRHELFVLANQID